MFNTSASTKLACPPTQIDSYRLSPLRKPMHIDINPKIDRAEIAYSSYLLALLESYCYGKVKAVASPAAVGAQL